MSDSPAVTAFTDTYHPTINGVTYTIDAWSRVWNETRGTMDVVYPASDHEPAAHEHPVPSLPFPFYDGYRAGVPMVPDAVAETEVVHCHSIFPVGIAGWRLATRRSLPLVVSYHTPMVEYASYVAPTERLAGALASGIERFERRALGAADLVVTPSAATRRRVENDVGIDGRVEVLSNGVDTSHFRPVETGPFEDRYDLAGRLVGYTGRHGYEKNLEELLAAGERLPDDVTVVFGGTGPSTGRLKRLARQSTATVRFLGLLDRDELPAFYSALDVFAFPSTVETEGIVAMEAMACGTPVVGAAAGALPETIRDDETGYLYEPGDVDAFVADIERAFARSDRLERACLDGRPSASVEASVDRLATLYEQLR